MIFFPTLRNCALVGAIFLSFHVKEAKAATFTVTSTADSGSGSLRQAILDANAAAGADTITFALPSSSQTIELTSAGSSASALVLSGDVTLQGPGADLLTVQRSATQGTSDFSVLAISSGVTAEIRGLTISNGKNASYAITIPSGDGGGAPGRAYYPGGGIVNQGTLTLENCTVSGNAARGGYRTSGGYGGGIYSTGTLSLDGCTFSANTALRGGAIYGAATITNCTFSGNSATGNSSGAGHGGAVYMLGDSTIISSTFSGNTAEVAGSSVFNTTQTTVTVSNSIFNDAAGVTLQTTGTFKDGGYNLARSDGDGLLKASTDKLNTDPRLGALSSYGASTPTFSLTAGSPAIDAGDTALETDQRGMPRPYGSADDIGAFERQTAGTPSITSVGLMPDAPRTDDPLTAVVTATDFNNDPLTFTYSWLRTRNGKTTRLAETRGTLTTEGDIVILGDVIEVTVVASNGTFESAPQSASVTIENTPITVAAFTLQPKTPYTSEKMIATVKNADADKPRAFYSYVWTKNGAVMQTVTNSRNSQDFYDLNQKGRGDKGDVIAVAVTVSDGDTTATAQGNATIRNSVPVLSQLNLAPQAPTPGQVVTSTYGGRDADGDALTKIYSWKIGKKVLAGETGSRLDLAKYPTTKAGDIVALQMRLSDGESLSKTLAASVTVAARQAKIAPVQIEPSAKST